MCKGDCSNSSSIILLDSGSNVSSTERSTVGADFCFSGMDGKDGCVFGFAGFFGGNSTAAVASEESEDFNWFCSCCSKTACIETSINRCSQPWSYSCRMSSGAKTGIAPSRRYFTTPAYWLSNMSAGGKQKTGLPCSIACSAVINAPLPIGAWITNVPPLTPAKIRFRIGKFCRDGSVPGRNSDNSKPFRMIYFFAEAFGLGYGTSRPQPITATVFPPESKAARWATESNPTAKPLTSSIPLFARHRHSKSAVRMLYELGFLVPTTVKAG